jgi:membrane protein YdbS with pleckstrin-like domain
VAAEDELPAVETSEPEAPLRRRRSIPLWVWITSGLWLLVYLPLSVHLLQKYGSNWFVMFFVAIIPVWVIVRIWIYRVSRRR